MTDLKNKIKELSNDLFDTIIAYRRHIHKNPELSYNEYKTSKFICSVLDKNKIKYKQGFVKTGIVAKIQSTKNYNKKIIAIRADIDALPITENNTHNFVSQNKGVMHACGHDVHTANLLGVGIILNTLRDKFEGTVYLIFQPAEEKLPGGAKLMLEENIFGTNKPDAILALHVQPTLKAGSVGFKAGEYMASTDEIYLTVKGKGGHAAMPHQINDTILATSNIIVNLQSIVSRFVPASIPTVISFGKIIANGATNIIPDEVKVEGTMRTMSEIWRKKIHKEINNIAKNVAKSHNTTCDVKIIKGYPVLKNNIELTKKCKKLSQEYLGKKQVKDLDIRMTAEDFAYFSQKYPSVLFRLGTSNNNKNTQNPLHSSNFNIDEKALKTSVGLISWLSVSILNDKKN